MLLFEVLTLKGGNFVPDVTLRHCCVIKYECQDELNLCDWRESYMKVLQNKTSLFGERTGLVVRALDSGSGDPGSFLGRVGVLFP